MKMEKLGESEKKKNILLIGFFFHEFFMAQTREKTEKLFCSFYSHVHPFFIYIMYTTITPHLCTLCYIFFHYYCFSSEIKKVMRILRSSFFMIVQNKKVVFPHLLLLNFHYACSRKIFV